MFYCVTIKLRMLGWPWDKIIFMYKLSMLSAASAMGEK